MFVIPYKELTDKDSVILNSGTVHITNNITLKQKQAWLYMVYRAFPKFEEQKLFRIYKTDLLKAINYNSDNKEHLRELLKGLADCSVEFNLFNKDGSGRWLVAHLLASCEIVENQGIIEYEFSEKIKEKLINPIMYTKLNLVISKKFKSKHALNIYMIALDYLVIKNNSSEKNFTIDEIKKYLGLSDIEGNNKSKYRTVDIHKHILKKAEKEINELSDMNISIKPIKPSNRKITGFKFQMSMKDEYLDFYKTNSKDNQTNLFEMLEAPKEKIVNHEIKVSNNKAKKTNDSNQNTMKVEGKELKKFYAEHKISITTNTIQEKLKEIKDIFHENFEDYLVFLMNYTIQETDKSKIKNISGFYVGLVKDNSQLENYLYYHQKEKIEKENKVKKVKELIETELQKRYEKYILENFEEYINLNQKKIEAKALKVLEKTLKSGDFIYDTIIARKYNGKADKTILTASSQMIKSIIINHLSKYKNELGYKQISFDYWKEENVTDKYLETLRLEVEKSL